jgi:ribonuclease HI
MESYYVVKKGFKTGIFKTWGECKTAVDGFSGPIFKKFESYPEASEFFKSEIVESKFKTLNAEPFIANKNKTTNKMNKVNSNTVLSETDKINMEKIKAMTKNIKSSEYSNDLNYNVDKWNIINDDIYIFTDGSSRKSQEFFNSGVGVYLGYNCTNIKEQYNNKTNNQCELMGMDYAFKLIVRYYRELSIAHKQIKIVSDSEYSIKSCSVWLPAWKKNNWKTAKGEDVKNKDIIESIDGNMMRIKIINSKLEGDNKIKVKLIHINSHQPCPDINDKVAFNIWFGNYIADGLAQNSI